MTTVVVVRHQRVNMRLLMVLEVADDAAVMHSYRCTLKQYVCMAPMFVLWCTHVMPCGVGFLHNVRLQTMQVSDFVPSLLP